MSRRCNSSSWDGAGGRAFIGTLLLPDGGCAPIKPQHRQQGSQLEHRGDRHPRRPDPHDRQAAQMDRYYGRVREWLGVEQQDASLALRDIRLIGTVMAAIIKLWIGRTEEQSPLREGRRVPRNAGDDGPVLDHVADREFCQLTELTRASRSASTTASRCSTPASRTATSSSARSTASATTTCPATTSPPPGSRRRATMA
jgi:hypothetical protein